MAEVYVPREVQKDGIVIPYRPRKHQMSLHAQLDRFNVLVLHRRFGKTVMSINELIKRVVECEQPKPRGAYIAPFRQQAKIIAWDYLIEYTSVIPGMKYNVSELRADFPNGARITLYGADNPHALRGIYLDCVVIDEVAQIAPSLWSSVIRPLLADRKGSAILLGTPFGVGNLFHDLYEVAGEREGWFRKILKASDTNIVDAEELEAARLEMAPEEYNQEFECSWSAAIRGAFYAKEMHALEEAGQVGNVPYDNSLPVITSWDLGVKDSTVVWYWQAAGPEIRAIRCEAFQGMKLSDIIARVDSHGYRFSQHIAPHDIEVRELGAGSRKRLAADLGVRFDVAPRLSVMDGINAVRQMLPRVWFDRELCRDGIAALQTYRTEYNEKLRVFSNTPLHSYESDYADSVRYFAVTKTRKTMRHENQRAFDYSEIDQGIV